SVAVLHDHDHRVTGLGVLSPGAQPSHFWAAYPSSDAETPFLLQQLAGHSTVSVDSQSGKAVAQFVATYVLPLVLLANLFALIFIGAAGSGGDAVGGLQEFGGIGRKRGAKQDDEQRITFADVAGANDAVIELAEVKDYLTDPARFAALGARPP